MFTDADIRELRSVHDAALASLGQISYPNGRPVYPQPVTNLVRLLSEPRWLERDYRVTGLDALMEDPSGAGQREVRAILTCFTRAERFGEGNWAAMLESGVVSRAIGRAFELSSTADDA